MQTMKRYSKEELDITVVEASDRENQQKFYELLGKEWILLGGFVLVAFLIRLWMVKFDTRLEGDDVWYATLGKNLISGNFRDGLSTYWPPLYPVLVGLSSLLFHDLEFAGRFVSIAAGSLLVIPVYLLGRNLYGSRIASIGAFFVIINPLLISVSTGLMTESTYALTFTIAILLGLSAVLSGKGQLFILTGLAFGACYLIKPEALGYVGLMIALAFCVKLIDKKLSIRKVVLNSLFLLTAFLLLSGPYILYIHEQTGTWTISTKLNANLSNSQADSRRLTSDGQLTKADILFGGARPEPVVTRLSRDAQTPPSNSSRGVIEKIKKLREIFVQSAKGLFGEYGILPELTSPIFIVLASLGLFGTAWSKDRAVREIYLILFLLATLVGYSLTFFQSRYLIHLLPFFLCWGAKGAAEFEDWLIASLRRSTQSKHPFMKGRKIVRPVILGVLVLILLPWIIAVTKSGPSEPPSVALWIKEHSGPSPVILATSPWVAFRAGGKHFYIPNEAYPVVIDYSRRKKVNYIVIEERQIWRTSELRFLLDEQNRHPDLKLVYKYDEERQPKVLVFQLTDPSSSPANSSPG